MLTIVCRTIKSVAVYYGYQYEKGDIIKILYLDDYLAHPNSLKLIDWAFRQDKKVYTLDLLLINIPLV